jgi:hypothetical protein
VDIKLENVTGVTIRNSGDGKGLGFDYFDVDKGYSIESCKNGVTVTNTRHKRWKFYPWQSVISVVGKI